MMVVIYIVQDGEKIKGVHRSRSAAFEETDKNPGWKLTVWTVRP